mgnify:CR=1 FL=1
MVVRNAENRRLGGGQIFLLLPTHGDPVTEALIFDPLTFPLSTGDEEFIRSALETLDGIRAIEADMPGVMTILGISNVSFGLNPVARKIVNAVFLYHAVEAGLDLAIVHPSHVMPFAEIPQVERELAEDLVLAADVLDVLIEGQLAAVAAVRAAHLEKRPAVWYLHETLVAVRLIQAIPEMRSALTRADLLVTPTQQTARIYEGLTHAPIEVVPGSTASRVVRAS